MWFCKNGKWQGCFCKLNSDSEIKENLSLSFMITWRKSQPHTWTVGAEHEQSQKMGGEIFDERPPPPLCTLCFSDRVNSVFHFSFLWNWSIDMLADKANGRYNSSFCHWSFVRNVGFQHTKNSHWSFLFE